MVIENQTKGQNMLYSAESFLQLHHLSEGEFDRELEYRRLARERFDEKKNTGRRGLVAAWRHASHQQ
ncbi:hypothetical protein [Subtercola endophyticus]|uniref:hypothetical protein n=1 Tax=Subtercola endophyticus TaxID=2895559 RepID=UPI001E5B1AD2|nr:hypothetical protein [Subtercola endophyticus]UFS60579.1 hypothetical protein LQ955_07510 [Subtercola endophyticus]